MLHIFESAETALISIGSCHKRISQKVKCLLWVEVKAWVGSETA